MNDAEYAVLGVIIATIERAATRRRPKRLRVKDLETVLVARGRLSRYHLDKVLRRLSELGYIQRHFTRLSYGPRLELEFDQERRQAITSAANIFLAGTVTSESSSGDSE